MSRLIHYFVYLILTKQLLFGIYAWQPAFILERALAASVLFTSPDAFVLAVDTN